VALDAAAFLRLLARRSNDPDVEAALVELRTRRRPELDPTNREAFHDWVVVRRRGIEFGFADEAYFYAQEIWQRRRDPAALILFQLYFYDQFEDVSRFDGELPFGLTWDDNRHDVQRKLKEHDQALRSYLRDSWELPEFWMTVTYKKANRGIDSIVCQLEPKPWPEEGRAQPVVGRHDWLDLFGLPPTAPRLRNRLEPLDLEARILEDEDDEEVLFRHECGLELVFTPARNLKNPYRSRLERKSPTTLVLGAVRFLRSRELDARQWTGALPFDLSFDDTQRTVQAKLARKPDEQEDDDLDGFAVWRFPEYSLHVLYDNMKNRVQRISIMAPGFD
jgi:hypothetical protein